MADAKSDKSAAKALFEMVGLETEKYRLGHTKVLENHILLLNIARLWSS